MKKQIKEFIFLLQQNGIINKNIKKYLYYLKKMNQLKTSDKLCITEYNNYMIGGSLQKVRYDPATEQQENMWKALQLYEPSLYKSTPPL